MVAGWEDATAPAARAGIRTVQVRTGIVQTPRGGMLRLLYPLFAAGLGGGLATASSGWPGSAWTTLDIYLPAVTDRPVVNAVAPAPVRNSEYTATGPAAPARAGAVRFGPRLLLGAEGAVSSPRPASTSARSG